MKSLNHYECHAKTDGGKYREKLEVTDPLLHGCPQQSRGKVVTLLNHKNKTVLDLSGPKSWRSDETTLSSKEQHSCQATLQLLAPHCSPGTEFDNP